MQDAIMMTFRRLVKLIWTCGPATNYRSCNDDGCKDEKAFANRLAKGVKGEWKTTAVDGGIEARFESADGKLLGFALMGAATAQRGALSKELPPILS